MYLSFTTSPQTATYANRPTPGYRLPALTGKSADQPIYTPLIEMWGSNNYDINLSGGY